MANLNTDALREWGWLPPDQPAPDSFAAQSKGGIAATAQNPSAALLTQAAAKAAVGKVDEMRATARTNKLAGFAADALAAVDQFGRKPFGYDNPPVALLSDALGVPAVQRTLDRVSYGEPLTTGAGMTTRIQPEAMDALLALAPIGKPAKVAGATAKELAAAQRNAARAVGEGGLGLTAENTAAQRAAAMGYEGGFYRGGEAPVNGNPTGPWYTTVKDEAADYAARTPEAVRDVREYALPTKGVLRFDRGYSSEMAMDLAGMVERDGHAKAAAELRKYYGDGTRMSGMEAYKFLQRYIGEGAPDVYLPRLGFKQVDGVNSPNYRQALDQTVVRDASRAAFDPARRAERNIFAGVAGGGVGVPLLYGQSGDDR